MIRFQHPLWLLALTLPVLSVWLSARAGSRGASRVPAALRAALLTAVVLSLAGIHLRLPPRDITTVFLIDRSLSVPAEEQARAWRWVTDALSRAGGSERAAVIAFGADAAVEAEPQPRLRLGAARTVVTRDASDIAGALRLAHALLPPDGAGRIILFSDGLETDGDMLEEGERLAAAGLAVDVFPLSGAAASDVIAVRLDAPADAAEKETFELKAAVWASTSMVVRARLFRGDDLVASRSVELSAGRSLIPFQDRLDRPGLTRYNLYLDSPSDKRPQNNQASRIVEVRGPPSALLVEGSNGHGAGVARALRAAGIRARTVGIAGYPRDLAELAQYSAVILDNVPAYALSPRRQAETRTYVGDLGGGLVMLGGDHSFAAGGYQNTPIEEALPVNMESKRPDQEASLAIAVLIDRSGSMSAPAPSGVEKIQLAAEGAIRLVEMLRPEQTIGVCAVDTQPDWIAPLSSSKAGMVDSIGKLRAGGGGIYVYTALEAAWDALKGVKSSVRHVILFSDSADAEEQDKNGRSALDLITQMNASGITVSAIALGRPEDKDTAFLEQAARAGKGRFYQTSDSESLPSIFIREGVLVRRSAFVQETFKAKVKRTVDPVKGIDWPSAPELKGYVLAEAKDAADVGLVSHRGDPILASWRYGLGRSMAFTSDAQGAWSERWSRWPGAGKLWTQTARWVAKQPSPDRLSLRTEVRGREARVIVEAAAADGSPMNFMRLEGQAVSPDLSKEPLAFSQTGLGRYEAELAARAEGAYLMRVQGSSGDESLERVGSFIVTYPAEFQHNESDSASLARLAEITRGRWAPAQDKLFLHEPSRSRRPVDLSRLFLALAALILPFDVASRRLRWRAEAWQPAIDAASSRWERVRGRLAAWLPAAQPSAAGAAPAAETTAALLPQPGSSWDRLKDAKRRARKR